MSKILFFYQIMLRTSSELKEKMKTKEAYNHEKNYCCSSYNNNNQIAFTHNT